MGLIKESNGVDFVIKSEPLTESFKKEISEFIHIYSKNKLVGCQKMRLMGAAENYEKKTEEISGIMGVNELNIDVIGGMGPLTEKEELDLSLFFRRKNAKAMKPGETRI